jgi:hypothetical protein
VTNTPIVDASPATLKHIENSHAAAAHGHETRPLLAVPPILVARSKINVALAFCDEQRLAGRRLDHEFTDIELCRRVRYTDGGECGSKAMFTDIQH